jgi:hypothetical protein
MMVERLSFGQVAKIMRNRCDDGEEATVRMWGGSYSKDCLTAHHVRENMLCYI